MVRPAGIGDINKIGWQGCKERKCSKGQMRFFVAQQAQPLLLFYYQEVI